MQNVLSQIYTTEPSSLETLLRVKKKHIYLAELNDKGTIKTSFSPLIIFKNIFDAYLTK